MALVNKPKLAQLREMQQNTQPQIPVRVKSTDCFFLLFCLPNKIPDNRPVKTLRDSVTLT